MVGFLALPLHTMGRSCAYNKSMTKLYSSMFVSQHVRNLYDVVVLNSSYGFHKTIDEHAKIPRSNLAESVRNKWLQ